MKLKILISLVLLAVGAGGLMAQDTPDKAENPFAPNSCLAAQSEGKRWAGYCNEAQALHAGLSQRTRTASIELSQLKKLLFDANDITMWQFLSLSLAERSPYYGSSQRKLSLMDEIEKTIKPSARADRFVALAVKEIRSNATGEGPADTLVAEAQTLLEGETNPHLLELLSSTLIKHTNAEVALGNYEAATASLQTCEKASDAWGNPLMPQRCYNLVRLTGREPEEFLKHVATREEALTCGRDLKPLCNLFRKTGHGKYLAGNNAAG